MLSVEPGKNACSCGSDWLCFDCQMNYVEMRDMNNDIEAEYRRRTLTGEDADGDDKTAYTGWSCECGGEIESDAKFSKCIGCNGIRAAKVDPLQVHAREKALTKTALAWT